MNKMTMNKTTMYKTPKWIKRLNTVKTFPNYLTSLVSLFIHSSSSTYNLAALLLSCWSLHLNILKHLTSFKDKDKNDKIYDTIPVKFEQKPCHFKPAHLSE